MNLIKRIEMAAKHRGQSAIQTDEGSEKESSRFKFFFEKSYDNIEVVRRGVDIIVDAATDVDINITKAIPATQVHEGPKQRKKSLEVKLNFAPNNNEDINEFRRQLYTDLILTGNSYQYWDGANLFQLPAKLITVKTGSRDKKVIWYEMANSGGSPTKFQPEEIIHVKDNSGDSVYTGTSRLLSTKHTISILKSMLNFQENFFDNGAIPGLVIQTPNILGDRIKNKLLAAWKRRYNPSTGGKQPMILDADLKVNPLSQTKFSELDFEESISSHELKILKALGIPPVLLNSGNNANLRPNIQLLYEMTVLPLVSKVISSYEKYFAYDMEPDVAKVRALRPELRDAAQYYQGLVNTGIMTPNEARLELRLEKSSEAHADELRIPQNIAGSATDPTEGGRPVGDSDDEDSNENSSNEED